MRRLVIKNFSFRSRLFSVDSWSTVTSASGHYWSKAPASCWQWHPVSHSARKDRWYMWPVVSAILFVTFFLNTGKTRRRSERCCRPQLPLESVWRLVLLWAEFSSVWKRSVMKVTSFAPPVLYLDITYHREPLWLSGESVFQRFSVFTHQGMGIWFSSGLGNVTAVRKHSFATPQLQRCQYKLAL